MIIVFMLVTAGSLTFFLREQRFALGYRGIIRVAMVKLRSLIVIY